MKAVAASAATKRRWSESSDAPTKKALKKAGELTEDDQKKAEKDIQDLTDKHVKKIDEMCAKKEKELMEI